MYAAGSPGLGKSLTMWEFFSRCETRVGPADRLCFLNAFRCGHSSSPSAIYAALLEAIKNGAAGKGEGGVKAMQTHEARAGEQQGESNRNRNPNPNPNPTLTITLNLALTLALPSLSACGYVRTRRILPVGSHRHDPLVGSGW